MTALKPIAATTLALVLFVSTTLAESRPSAALPLIPQPVEAVTMEGHFKLGATTSIVATTAAAAEAGKLAAELRAATGLPLPLRKERGPDSIHLAIDPDLEGTGPEGYRMRITEKGVAITAPATAGLYYAGRSLLQLADGDHRLPQCEIHDQPRFAWRGLMLDCSRTFQSLDYLRATLDRMAFYKLNVLHLHLTDDQGWRLEIKAFPKLARMGGRFAEKYNEPPERQGFYTQRDMKELIAYAAARHITLVPEIEMPGHTLALLSVMPHLSCTGGPFEIYPFFQGPQITQDIFCAGNDETFRVLNTILGEVAELFPSGFIHIGGDEAPKARWKECERCQSRIQKEGLKNEEELQSWFIRRASAMLAAKGKRLIGWDEILEGGLAPGAAVMSWRDTKSGVTAATAGHDVVLSPTQFCYFDYPYNEANPRRPWEGPINSQRVFFFEPLEGFPPETHGRVLGIQANFWSHIDREPALVDGQLFPRLLALAERAWVPADRRDWEDYHQRARKHLPRLKQFGVAFHPGDLDEPPAETP
jgi:hexosaminidase